MYQQLLLPSVNEYRNDEAINIHYNHVTGRCFFTYEHSIWNELHSRINAWRKSGSNCQRKHAQIYMHIDFFNQRDTTIGHVTLAMLRQKLWYYIALVKWVRVRFFVPLNLGQSCHLIWRSGAGEVHTLPPKHGVNCRELIRMEGYRIVISVTEMITRWRAVLSRFDRHRIYSYWFS